MSHKISHTIKWFKEFNHVLPICLLYFTLSTFVKTYHITYLYCHKIVKMTSLNMRVLFPKEETIVEWTFMQYVKWMYIYLSLLLVGVPWMNELIRFVAKGTLGHWRYSCKIITLSLDLNATGHRSLQRHEQGLYAIKCFEKSN